jgi:amino acid transporter
MGSFAPPELRKNLSRRDVFCFLLCTLVGLDTLGSVAARGSQGFLWLLFLAVSFFVPYALAIAELGSAFPQEGGVYVWTRRALGRSAAGITTFFYWISNPIWLGGALTVTAITTWNTFFFDLGARGKYAFGFALIWSCVLATVVSLRHGRWVTFVGSCARLVLLALFTLSVVLYGVIHSFHGARLPHLAPTFEGLTTVAPLLVFNFVGFELPSAAGGEMEDPERDVPFAVLRAAVASVLCYGLPVLAILLVLPTEKITGLRGFIDSMRLVFTVYGGGVVRSPNGVETVVLQGAGRWLGAVAAIGFIVALATSAISWIMGADRSQAVACADGAGPRALGAFARGSGTPVAINVASGVVATAVMLGAFAVAGGSAERFFAAALSLGISTTTISYLGIFPALYLLRRRAPDVARPYRVPGGDWGAFVATSSTFAWALFATVYLIWPGLGTVHPDAALPADFVVRDAAGRVVSSQRALFELTQLVPLVALAGLAAVFLAWGARQRRAARSESLSEAAAVARPSAAPPRPSRPPSLRPAPG